MFPFDSPKNIREPNVFWCFQGDQKGTLGRNGINNELNDWDFWKILSNVFCDSVLLL